MGESGAMEKQKNRIRIKLTTIVWCILAILLCASPCGAQFVVDVNEIADIDYAIEDNLLVLGTANLYPGAYIDWGVYASTGCTVNIYGGEIGDGYFVLLYTGEPIPVVTVYGTDFALDGVPLDPLADYFMTDSSGYGVLTGTYENGDPIDLLFYSDVPIFLRSPQPSDIEVTIDIKPGSNKNNINLKSWGIVPVAVLTTDDFDAGTVDPATVEFAGAAPVRWKLADVDHDGDDDMMFHFRTWELDLDQDSTEATLTGQTTQGVLIEGSDEVRIISFCRRNLRNRFSRDIRPVWNCRNRNPIRSSGKSCKCNVYNGRHKSDR